MNLTIRYFGLLAEVTKSREEEFAFEGLKIHELKSALALKYPLLADRKYQVAQSGEIATDDSDVIEGIIALLPPYAGG